MTKSFVVLAQDFGWAARQEVTRQMMALNVTCSAGRDGNTKRGDDRGLCIRLRVTSRALRAAAACLISHQTQLT